MIDFYDLYDFRGFYVWNMLDFLWDETDPAPESGDSDGDGGSAGEDTSSGDAGNDTEGTEEE